MSKKAATKLLLQEANASNLLTCIDSISLDTNSIPQSHLDIVTRRRSNPFPWRGQFAPELVEVLLETYSDSTSVILDPFVGSGTTLFEAARKTLTCYGAEINPAAIEMAKTVHFVNIEHKKRQQYLLKARELLFKHFPPDENLGELFTPHEKEELRPNILYAKRLQQMLKDANQIPAARNILLNSAIRYMSSTTLEGSGTFLQAFMRHTKIVEELPFHKHECRTFHCDSRALPITSNSVDLIITSPPYINVFNYHQNYRPLMELVGWNLLTIAKSEIGSNRKNRGNRFLTVVQFCIDMMCVLLEISRILKPNGRAIVIIGRESRVRGMSFENGRILTALAVGTGALQPICRQERKFINRFGKIIFEDILHLTPMECNQLQNGTIARRIAIDALEKAFSEANKEDVRHDIQTAIDFAESVEGSPVLI